MRVAARSRRPWLCGSTHMAHCRFTQRTDRSGLAQVSCVGATFCAAVGTSPTATSQDETLALVRKTAGWALTSSPNVTGADTNELADVSCASTSFCMAVGKFYYNTYQPLIERWNGTAWQMVASNFAPTNFDHYLYGVSCVSTTFCMAVGNYSGYGQTLIERWNGSSWSVMTSPDSGGLETDLLSVSCTSTTFCMAAGAQENPNQSGQYLTVAMRWNGSAWLVVPAGTFIEEYR
jgi:hypothetical protein